MSSVNLIEFARKLKKLWQKMWVALLFLDRNEVIVDLIAHSGWLVNCHREINEFFI